jgi:hypothetical protein
MGFTPPESSAGKGEPERFSRKEAQEAQGNIHSSPLCLLRLFAAGIRRRRF